MAQGGKEAETELARALVKQPVKLAELERLAIEAALRRTNGNVTRAVRQLGIGRTTLYRRLTRYAAMGHPPFELVDPEPPPAPPALSGPGRELLEAFRG
jgi:DNA-binding NtrC family response regulator